MLSRTTNTRKNNWLSMRNGKGRMVQISTGKSVVDHFHSENFFSRISEKFHLSIATISTSVHKKGVSTSRLDPPQKVDRSMSYS